MNNNSEIDKSSSENKRLSRIIMVGNVPVGGKAPVAIQSMCNTDTSDKKRTLRQIRKLHRAGCEIIRLAVPDKTAAEALPTIIKRSPIPVVADIHFDHRLALMSIDAGIAKLRLNPGNIDKTAHVAKVAKAASDAGIPIRVGANSGSLPKDLLKKYGHPCAEALAEAVLIQAAILREHGFEDIVLSAKSSSVLETISACRILGQKCDYPLHIGVTEAGTRFAGSIRSAAALSPLLLEGLGDTIRISLAGNPLNEIFACRELLQCLGLRCFGPEVIACPTCARTEINVERLALTVEKIVRKLKVNTSSESIVKPIKIAVMGCVVNGPGEAREADIAVCGGRDRAVLFIKGVKQAVLKKDEIQSALIEAIENL